MSSIKQIIVYGAPVIISNDDLSVSVNVSAIRSQVLCISHQLLGYINVLLYICPEIKIDCISSNDT